MNNINEIELDMWLELNKTANDQGEVRSFYADEEKYYVHISPKGETNINFLCKNENGEELISWSAFYNSPNKKFELAVNPTYLSNIDWFPVGNMFERSIQDFLDTYHLDQNQNRYQYNPVQYQIPDFTKEEEKFFGDTAENLFDDDYLEQNWLGQGGFREVYDLGNFVLKVAHDENSLYTAIKVNESEANHQIHQEFPELTVKTYKHDPNYAWIIQDKVKGLSDWDDAKILKYFNLADDDFIRLSGRECENKISEALDQIIKGFKDIDNLKAKRMIEKGRAENFNRTKKNIYDRKIGHFDPKIIQLAKMVMKYNIDRDDFKPSNFGETADGRIVVIDLGTHYSIGVL